MSMEVVFPFLKEERERNEKRKWRRPLETSGGDGARMKACSYGRV